MTLFAAGDGAEIVQSRQPTHYTPAEQHFSRFIEGKMTRLLRGDDNELFLMRRYCQGTQRVAFFMPTRVERSQIRPSVAEAIVAAVLRFLDPFSPGGPISQHVREGNLIETRIFPTQYPHIVVHRRDVFASEDRSCLFVEWKAMRIQNQRKSTLINRALDIGNLAMEVARFIRPG